MAKKAKKNRTQAAQSGKDVIVNVILDRSGSMDSNRDGTIDGYNEFLSGLRKDKETNYTLTLTQFDSPINQPELTVSYVDKPLSDVTALSRDTYEPRGGTPLYDAIGETIRRIEDKVKGRMVMTVIITDGQENSSREFKKEDIRDLIKRKEALGWKFVFLGADIDSYAASSVIGVMAQSTATYGNNPVHTMAAFRAVSDSARAYSMSHRMGTYNACADVFTKEARSSMGDKPDYTSKLKHTTFTGTPDPDAVHQTVTDWTTNVQPSGGTASRFHGSTPRSWTVVSPDESK